LAFTQGAHYGFAFTLVLAILGFLLACMINFEGPNSGNH